MGAGDLRARRGSAGPARADELERLARLHADGRLTDDEFETAKAQALGLVEPKPSEAKSRKE